MLCKINPTVGGATDEKARAINMLRAIQAICTAAANTTPTCPSQTANTASPSGTDVITEVISNTEAGGWANSSSTNVVSDYDENLGVPYQLDLYRDSGKGTYPYRKLSFRTNPYVNPNSIYFSNYPYILISHGFNTANNASGNYLLGQTVSMPNSATTNLYRFDVNLVSSDANSMTYGSCLFKPAAGEWLIASTSQYFIALSGTLGTTGYPGAMYYVGLRTTNDWENQYDDNPPLASVCYDGGYYYNYGPGRNASMWARTLGPDGTVNLNPAWYRIDNQGYNNLTVYGTYNDGRFVDPLSGVNFNASNATVPNSTYALGDYYWGNELQVPMLGGHSGLLRSVSRSGNANVGPITDPITGTFVPPAFPITFARNKISSWNTGGTAIGIYKSLGGTDAFMNQYYAPGQTFVLNGEGYYPYAIGNDTSHRDLFLIRKA